MINQVYQRYFQKSHSFLYPLLRIKRPSSTVLAHKKTYVALEGLYKPEDMKLIVVYNNPKTEEWLNYQKSVLVTHKMLETCIDLPETDEILYVYNMSSFKDDYNYFLAGKYSKFSSEAKRSISSYFGVHTPEWAYLETYVHPAKYFAKYAEILGVEEEVLKEIGELCDMYNREKECLQINIPETYKNLK